MKKRFFSRLLCMALVAAFLTPALAVSEPELSVTAKTTSVDVGDTFTVNVELDSNPGLETIQLDILYDTDVLICTKLESGKLLTQDGAIFAGNENNNGKATFAAITTGTISGDGVLAKLTFTAKAAGSSDIALNIVRLLSDGAVISAETAAEEIEVTGNTPAVTPSQPTELPTVPPAEVSDLVFSDVPKTHGAYSYIQNVVKQGLFTGISNHQFGPDMNVTRGMFVTVLYSNAGAPSAEPSTFSDVAADAWYSKCVSWASEQGIVSGIGNNKFGPELSITREQLALILYQYAKGTSPGTEAYVRMFYPDGKDIHDWALTAMSWAVNEGLISGKTGNRLAPQDTATRAEVAVIMQNFVNMSK